MPIIIGIILGLACLISGMGFWGYLPNGDLLAIFNEAIVHLSIETGQINLFGLILWGFIFAISISTLMFIIAIITIATDRNSAVDGSVVGVGSVVGIGVVGGIVGGIVGGVVGGIVGGIVGGVVGSGGVGLGIVIVDGGGGDIDYLTSEYSDKLIILSGSAVLTILFIGFFWLLLRPVPLPPPPPVIPPPTLTVREMTLVAMEQANDRLIAEITGTSTQLTANAHSTAIQLTLNAENTATQIAQNIIETATESALLSTEYALQQTQDALLALRQGTGVPTPPPISPTPYPTNTPNPTPTATSTSKPMSPTPSTTSDANITLTANAQAIASLEMQPTNTPEPTETSQPVEELSTNNAESVDITDTLRDPIWGGIAGLIAICGIPMGLIGLYFAWKQSKK